MNRHLVRLKFGGLRLGNPRAHSGSIDQRQKIDNGYHPQREVQHPSQAPPDRTFAFEATTMTGLQMRHGQRLHRRRQIDLNYLPAYFPVVASRF